MAKYRFEEIHYFNPDEFISAGEQPVQDEQGDIVLLADYLHERGKIISYL